MKTINKTLMGIAVISMMGMSSVASADGCTVGSRGDISSNGNCVKTADGGSVIGGDTYSNTGFINTGNIAVKDNNIAGGNIGGDYSRDNRSWTKTVDNNDNSVKGGNYSTTDSNDRSNFNNDSRSNYNNDSSVDSNDRSNFNNDSSITNSNNQNVTGDNNNIDVGGSIEADIPTETTNNVNYSGKYTVKMKNTPDAYAAPLTTSNGTCMGSSSAGGSAPGIGLSFGTTWTDKECTARYNAEIMHNMGYTEVSLQIMCQLEDVASAAGDLCKKNTKDGVVVMVPARSNTPTPNYSAANGFF